MLMDAASRGTSEVKQWMLTDKKTGQVLSASNTQQQATEIPGWLCANPNQGLNLPKTPLVGIAIAIAGHAFWNGSAWALGVITEGMPLSIQLI